ncbi:FAD-binding and (Fe-S)-binding domain-containing protein [Pontibacter sp. G13]|uniref:FAD-binding and (Fe-S)-binding domain-containing protein n=1 Tax=Pontibacter sp. G13 TaxID=3074898 RepID=UPI003906CC05
MKSTQLNILRASLDGDLFDDTAMRALYATDASVYREMPAAVAIPKHTEDLKQLVAFAKSAGTSLIPRAAGTSLAGQCVGSGIVVDTSKYFNQILEVNPEESWVRVQPGVIRDDLNKFLKPHGLFFGPNTSTANRAMVGGMVGNNSCGSYSIVYGTTRDHVMELEVILSDGSEVTFGPITQAEFEAKCKLNSLEGNLYRQIKEELSQKDQQQRIRAEFPKASIHRRNTGYAVDVLLESEVFTEGGRTFNFCDLLTGSEGTLSLISAIKLHCDPLPPKHIGLLAAHYETVDEALQSVLTAMKFKPRAVELMDKIIMDCTKDNRMYQQNRFFVQGDPGGILLIEVGGETEPEMLSALDEMESALTREGKCYAIPKVLGPDIKKVWDLRKAGLGLLANVPGDAKPVAVIEDTAVELAELPSYIRDFTHIMANYNQRSVYYAHAGAGELHLRPILDLKKSRDRQDFRDIARDTAELVKKYQGSLSGEHGDGRVRAEFIPLMVGEENYELLRRVKFAWDPQNIFNPGKIVDAPPMDESLRYEAEQKTPQFDTVMDFSDTGGILRAAEKCNGSGDCRKSHLSGGTMCPSFMATRNEKDTTRARANILREVLTRSNDENPFANPDIYEVMDLCLSCKGCASECPSNVNVASLKAEFLQQYYRTHGVPLRAKAFAFFGRLNKMASFFPVLSNFALSNKLSGGFLKRTLKVAPERNLPLIHKQTLRTWYGRNRRHLNPKEPKGKVYFFCDEFTDYNDTPIGIMGIKLLVKLGYEVVMVKHAESGRGPISKGLLEMAQKMASHNVHIFKDLITAETPLVGVEPSAILGFRDEYPRLVSEQDREDAKRIGQHALTIEEFLHREWKAGKISSDQFHQAPKQVLLHGHCHQKALSSIDPTVELLQLPKGYEVEVIPSGCCGMAGSFGYEAEHYALSMKVGELVLFPAVRDAAPQTLIAAPGTSCRHQIHDGTKRKALHPLEILWQALK